MAAFIETRLSTLQSQPLHEYKVVPLSLLRPFAPGNPRTHSAEQIEQLRRSIREFGFTNPILADETGEIIAGHGRLLAAAAEKLDTVPVIEIRGLSPAQKRALVIADNQLALNAGWDEALLTTQLGALASADFDLNLLGFSDLVLAELMKPLTGGLVDEDAIPEPLPEAVTRPGDLWILGSHRLLCGDSSVAADVDRLLDGDAVDLVNTDPPYNVKVEPRSNNAISAGLSSFQQTHHQSLDLHRHPDKAKATTKVMRAKDRPLINDYLSDEAFDAHLDAWFGNIARVLTPGRGFYIWGGYANCGNYPPVLKRLGLYFAQAVIWVKEHPVLTRKDFMGNHEWCFYGWKEGAAHRFFGPPNVTDVWSVKKVNPQSMVHLTEKPVELARRAIEYSSERNDVVLDLFGGSGSTLIAAEQTGRRARLMELDVHYCDIIVRRWQTFTGEKATRLSDGVAFDAAAAALQVA